MSKSTRSASKAPKYPDYYHVVHSPLYKMLLTQSRFPLGLNTRFGLYKAGEDEELERITKQKYPDSELVVEETQLQRITKQNCPSGDLFLVAISNLPDPVPYRRRNVRNQGLYSIRCAINLLNHALCSVPDENDEKYEGDTTGAFERDLDELWEKTDKMKPKGFPFSFHLMYDEFYEMDFLSDYDGPIYWNHCQREFLIDWDQPCENLEPGNKMIYSMLKPIKIREAGEAPLTVKRLCEAVAELNYYPGDHRFLEQVRVELRAIDGELVIVIIFKCGS